MAKSFLDIISLTRRIGEENNKMQRTPTARSSTTQTTQKKKKALRTSQRLRGLSAAARSQPPRCRTSRERI